MSFSTNFLYQNAHPIIFHWKICEGLLINSPWLLIISITGVWYFKRKLASNCLHYPYILYQLIIFDAQHSTTKSCIFAKKSIMPYVRFYNDHLTTSPFYFIQLNFCKRLLSLTGTITKLPVVTSWISNRLS
jgi:hypothetical protein